MLKNNLKILFPFIYGVFGVMAPIHFLDLDYGWTDIVYFWISSLVLYILLFKKIKGSVAHSFWACMVLFVPVTFLFEFVGLWVDGWGFDDKYPLWGLNIFGAPVEEFLFWFGAPPYVMLNYLWFHYALEERRQLSKDGVVYE
jgi:hypothetical protein